MTLKTYHLDWKENENAWKRRCEWREANKVVKKLRRHFKVKWDMDGMSALFVKTRRGSASIATNRISLPKTNISLGIINHEIAHLVARERYNSIKHDKKFLRALRVVNNYVKKMSYFDNMVQWNGKHKKQIYNSIPYYTDINGEIINEYNLN